MQRAHPQRLQRAFGRGFVVVLDDPETVVALRLSPTVFFGFTVTLGLGKGFTKPGLPPPLDADALGKIAGNQTCGLLAADVSGMWPRGQLGLNRGA